MLLCWRMLLCWTVECSWALLVPNHKIWARTIFPLVNLTERVIIAILCSPGECPWISRPCMLLCGAPEVWATSERWVGTKLRQRQTEVGTNFTTFFLHVCASRGMTMRKLLASQTTKHRSLLKPWVYCTQHPNWIVTTSPISDPSRSKSQSCWWRGILPWRSQISLFIKSSSPTAFPVSHQVAWRFSSIVGSRWLARAAALARLLPYIDERPGVVHLDVDCKHPLTLPDPMNNLRKTTISSLI